MSSGFDGWNAGGLTGESMNPYELELALDDLCSHFGEGLFLELSWKSHNWPGAMSLRWPRGATRFDGELKCLE